MKTYYGQMTKEELNKKYFVPSSIEEMNAFIDMCERAGCVPLRVDFTRVYPLAVGFAFKFHIGYNYSADSYINDESMTQINWNPEEKDLKSQLAQAMANLEKRQAKAQKAKDKLDQVKKEVDRIVAEIEKHYEEIDGVCCSVKVLDAKSNNIPEGVDVDDPSTWQDGDIVECVEITYNPAEKWFTVGKQYKYKSCCGIPYIAEDDDGDWSSIEATAKFRFVSRP